MQPIRYFTDKCIWVGHWTLASPVGNLQLIASANGLTALMRDDFAPQYTFVSEDSIPQVIQDAITSHLIQTRVQLEQYFSGSLQHFNLALDFKGTHFQYQVWQALQQIDYGKTCSYLDIARAIGRPKACRAVGAANGANPIAIVVPCHRVIGSSGKLTGYAYGLEMKQHLLNLEQSQFPLQN